MKLNLKVGDKVYDQLLFPNKEGVVIEIQQYLLVIKFENEDYFFPYKDDGDDSTNHFPVQLSKTPYEIIGLTSVAS